MAETNKTTPLDMPPPGMDVMQFYMQRARARIAERASSAPAPAPEPVLSPTPFNFEDRLNLERAIAKSDKLIADVQAQLAAPILAPSELTPEEQAEAASTKVKQYRESLTAMLLSHKLNQSQALYEEVMVMVDEMESKPEARPRLPMSRIPRPVNTNASAPECQARPSRIPRLSG